MKIKNEDNLKYIQYLSMNKLVLLISVILISCSSNKKLYRLEWNTKYPLTLHKDDKKDKLCCIKYPVKIILKNNSFTTRKLIGIEYFLGPGGSGFIFLHKEENGKLIRIKQRTRKLYMFQKKEFIAYAVCYPDANKISQDNFKPYLAKMAVENKDTLHIGVEKFRENNPNLLERITKGDEISINTKKEVIFIPADWKDK